MSHENCPVCLNELSSGYFIWHLKCKKCAYEKANLEPSINSNIAHQLIDESARATGLRELRQSNFKDILREIKSIKPNGGNLLDVGCAHGWFLELAQPDFKVVGIEPDHAVYEMTKKQGYPLLEGYFPDVLDSDALFDIIVFNDVFEHIPNTVDTLNACRKHLKDDGILVLNLPTSSGFFYKLSKILLKIKLPKPFDRMWQKDLPSPHLHYFNVENLIKLTDKHGFNAMYTGSLPSIRISGLYNRISYVDGKMKLLSFLIYIAVVLGMPFIKLFSSDIALVIVGKKNIKTEK
jgi:2-polyprenyl-3-methyl-5-hydroxy-6-metoxy-1,4-benzoquinol methylase